MENEMEPGEPGEGPAAEAGRSEPAGTDLVGVLGAEQFEPQRKRAVRTGGAGGIGVIGRDERGHSAHPSERVERRNPDRHGRGGR